VGRYVKMLLTTRLGSPYSIAERRVPELIPVPGSTIRYDTRCYFNVGSKADISQLNLPHGTVSLQVT